MAATYTIQQYNTLTAAIAQGVTLVEYGDKKVEYRTLNEMLRIKGLMETSLGLNTKTKRRKFISFKKGL